MRAAFFLLSSVLIFVECGCAEIPHTNEVTKKEASALVSQLTYGMREEDALRFLKQNGLTEIGADGDSLGWADEFDLPSVHAASLELGIEPKPLDPSGHWVNGILKEAFFYYPNGKQVPIPLKKAPKN